MGRARALCGVYQWTLKSFRASEKSTIQTAVMIYVMYFFDIVMIRVKLSVHIIVEIFG